jgi:Cerato-platanin
MICSATFALALLLTQVARALPQAGSASSLPASSTGSTYSPTSSQSYSPYSTTAHYSKTTDDGYSKGTPQYTSSPSPYASKGSYPPSSSGCPCSTPTPYPPMDQDQNGTTYSSDHYPTSSSCSCYSSTPYSSSQLPSYTSSSYSSPKVKYPPKATPTPYQPPSKPEKGSNPGSNTPSLILRATYDTTYDNKSGSLNNVACSDGPNGLAAQFPTFGDISAFPFIGGAFDVVWNSPNCGSCWNLTNMATGVSINITAIDSAGSGFNVAQEAFERLNGGQIGQGVVDVVANKISPSVCGL